MHSRISSFMSGISISESMWLAVEQFSRVEALTPVFQASTPQRIACNRLMASWVFVQMSLCMMDYVAYHRPTIMSFPGSNNSWDICMSSQKATDKTVGNRPSSSNSTTTHSYTKVTQEQNNPSLTNSILKPYRTTSTELQNYSKLYYPTYMHTHPKPSRLIPLKYHRCS